MQFIYIIAQYLFGIEPTAQDHILAYDKRQLKISYNKRCAKFTCIIYRTFCETDVATSILLTLILRLRSIVRFFVKRGPSISAYLIMKDTITKTY